MLIRILAETDYTPTAADSPRCYGQLRQRASVIETEIENADGTKSVQKDCGPMLHYFRVGATPDLPEETARKFIISGVAEPFDLDVKLVSKERILDMIESL